MRSLRSLAPFLLAVSLAACGRDSAREARAAIPADSVELGKDTLYGASAEAIVRTVLIEIQVADLPAGWEGMRIAALSDFQIGLWPDNEKVAAAAVRRAVAERPDLIVLLGDYVVRGGDYAALDRVLAPLRGRRVFAVLGNGDTMEDLDATNDTLAARATQALARAGVVVLRNERGRFVRNDDTAYIAGTEPLLARRPDWRRAEILGGITGAPSTVLLLTHMPAAAATLPTGKFPAVLAGHTFCGQVEVPGTPRLSWLNSEVLPDVRTPGVERIYRVRGATLFVTCGVGFSFVPVRLGHPPEVAIVTLRGIGGAAAETDSTAVRAAAQTDSLIQAYQQRDTTKSGPQEEAPDTTP